MLIFFFLIFYLTTESQLSGSEIQCQAGAGGTMQNSTSAIHYFIQICLLQHTTPIAVYVVLFQSAFLQRTFFLPVLGIVYNFLRNVYKCCLDLTCEILTEIAGIFLCRSRESN